LKQQDDLKELQGLIDETRDAAHSFKSSIDRLPQDSLTQDTDRHDAK